MTINIGAAIPIGAIFALKKNAIETPHISATTPCKTSAKNLKINRVFKQ
jgi:hypothetical protein